MSHKQEDEAETIKRKIRDLLSMVEVDKTMKVDNAQILSKLRIKLKELSK